MVTSCGEFVADVPIPISYEEFEKRFNISYQMIKYYRMQLFSKHAIDRYLTLIETKINLKDFLKRTSGRMKQKQANLIYKLNLLDKFEKLCKPLFYDPKYFKYYMGIIRKSYKKYLNALETYKKEKENEIYKIQTWRYNEIS